MTQPVLDAWDTPFDFWVLRLTYWRSDTARKEMSVRRVLMRELFPCDPVGTIVGICLEREAFPLGTLEYQKMYGKKVLEAMRKKALCMDDHQNLRGPS